MNFRGYILYSLSLDRFYVGYTSKGPLRTRQHRRKHPGWTGQANDWVEVFHCPTQTREEARALEKRIKARGAQRFLAARQPLAQSSPSLQPAP